MTWSGEGTMTDPAGSKPRPGVEVTCDARGCHAKEILGWHGGNVATIQRLLVGRGWAWTSVADGARDLCPEHAGAAS